MLLPVGLTVLVALGSLQPLPSIRDAMTLRAVPHAHVVVGPPFALLAPLYDIWDAMTLLPAAGHVMLLGALAAIYAVWRSRIVVRKRRWTVGRELAAAALASTTLVAWYVLGALIPRPMASLVVDDPDAVVVDFHSHTEASHDGRAGFTAERNREWHRSAGFNAAYISDHATYEAVHEALAHNPAHAGDGTVLLPGFETRYSGQHLNVLGFSAESTYGALSATALSSFSRATRPTALLTIPADLKTAGRARSTDGPILAVEVVDGSPRGLAFGRRRRAQLGQLAEEVHAAPVAGSNNHGWGRTAPGWTVLTIPGWRRLTPEMLDSAILSTLKSGERGRIVVVERAPPVPAGDSANFADLSLVFRNPFRSLGSSERVAWLAWSWSIWWMVAAARSRRRSP